MQSWPRFSLNTVCMEKSTAKWMKTGTSWWSTPESQTEDSLANTAMEWIGSTTSTEQETRLHSRMRMATLPIPSPTTHLERKRKGRGLPPHPTGTTEKRDITETLRPATTMCRGET